ncbi:hypothetical protein M5X11_00785 [Paenibacillus alginolyticus]|uniref:hypothetical protein n=1 Tax=Paenibacillus alginolyticus TaxID=59839 RepID=UPI000428951F|nr:hypothetical protein [Paenibacillus alginolyticus]MCY9663524.1 hypothetical protein [Paenibacillus alginolyticus]
MTIFHLNYFFEQGKYKEMKQYEFITSSIKENVRLFQMNSEKMRIEWKEIGVVSKFLSNKEYAWDKDALKEMFYDLGILVHACSICIEKLSEDQLLRLINKDMLLVEKFVRFSPNKQLKNTYNIWWADMDIQDQLVVWHEYHKKLEILSGEWYRLRKRACSSVILQKEKKVVSDYGTISLLETKPAVLVQHFLSIFGISELLDVVVIDISKVEELAATGFICMSEINKFREFKDVKLKFFLMEISKEQAMYEFNQRRLKLLSYLSVTRSPQVNFNELVPDDFFV